MPRDAGRKMKPVATGSYGSNNLNEEKVLADPNRAWKLPDVENRGISDRKCRKIFNPHRTPVRNLRRAENQCDKVYRKEFGT